MTEANQQSKTRRITMADIEAEIDSEHYFSAAEGAFNSDQRSGQPTKRPTADSLGRMTICILVLHNGFVVTGESACADPAAFNAEMGREVARANAIDKMWSLLGFRLRDELAADA